MTGIDGTEAVVRALALTAASFQAGDPAEALAIAPIYLRWIAGEDAASVIKSGDLPTFSEGPPVDMDEVRARAAESRMNRKAERERRKLEGMPT